MDDYIDRIAARHLLFLELVDTADPVELLKNFSTNYMRQSADTPEISKLIVKDCSEPGPYLDYLVERIQPVHRSITLVLERVQKTGFFKHHNPESCSSS